MIIRAFITHKQAENFTDCQDRFGVNPDTKSIAVSDGMGSSWQQKIWAQILVNYFINQHEWLPRVDTIKPLCREWLAKVIDFIQNLRATNAPQNMIYRNERSLAEGRSAGATFVGIRFVGKEWSGCVLGDSCLVEWNGHDAKFHTSQEIERFDSFPDYFDSDETKEGKGTPKSINGILAEGCLLLVSDPFSDFLFEHQKQGDIATFINQLLELSSHEDFEKLVEAWRNAGMHNDDTTLVIIENDNKEDFNLSCIDDIDDFMASGPHQECFEKETRTITENTDVQVSNNHEQVPPSDEDKKAFVKELWANIEGFSKRIKLDKGKQPRLKNFFSKRIIKIIERYNVSKK